MEEESSEEEFDIKFCTYNMRHKSTSRVRLSMTPYIPIHCIASISTEGVPEGVERIQKKWDGEHSYDALRAVITSIPSTKIL